MWFWRYTPFCSWNVIAWYNRSLRTVFKLLFLSLLLKSTPWSIQAGVPGEISPEGISRRTSGWIPKFTPEGISKRTPGRISVGSLWRISEIIAEWIFKGTSIEILVGTPEGIHKRISEEASVELPYGTSVVSLEELRRDSLWEESSSRNYWINSCRNSSLASKLISKGNYTIKLFKKAFGKK